MNERAFELRMRAPVRCVMFAMERRRRDRYTAWGIGFTVVQHGAVKRRRRGRCLAWGVSPRYEEIK